MSDIDRAVALVGEEVAHEGRQALAQLQQDLVEAGYVALPLSLLERLVDGPQGEDCDIDESGGCQEHGFLSLRSGQECPWAEVKRLVNLARTMRAILSS